MAQIIYDYKPNPLQGVDEALGILGGALDKRFKQEAGLQDQSTLTKAMQDFIANKGNLTPEALAGYTEAMNTPEGVGILNNLLARKAQELITPRILSEGARMFEGGQETGYNPKSFAPQVTATGAYTFNDGRVNFTQPSEIKSQQDFTNRLTERETASKINLQGAQARHELAQIDKLVKDSKLPRDEVERIVAVGNRVGIDTSSPEGFVRARDILKSEVTNDPSVISREAGKQAGAAIAQGVSMGTIKADKAAEAYQQLYDAAYEAMSKNSGPKTKGAGGVQPQETQPPATVSTLRPGMMRTVGKDLIANYDGEYWVVDKQGTKIRPFWKSGW